MLLNTPVCHFGWKAPQFTLKDPDGQSFTLSEQMGTNGLLIAFICNHCPYVKAIIERFVEDAKTLQSAGINVLAIMPNDYQYMELDSPANMKRFAANHQFTFPYLIDETQAVASEYGAVCTPDFFGFNNQGELQYRGRIDDARMGNAANRQPELVNAMLQVAQTDQGPKEQTASIGCSIKWR